MKASVDCFTDPSAFDRLRSEWTALEQKLSPRTPFSSPLWHETWWLHLRRRTWHTRDDLALCTVRDFEGQLIAVAPYMRTKRPGLGLFSLIELQALGADPHVTELRGIVCDPADQVVVMQALQAYFATARERPRWITWHNVRWCEGTQWQPPSALKVNNESWMRPQPGYIVDMPANWSLFESTLTKRVRKKIRHTGNMLNRDGKQVALHVVSEQDKIIEAVHTFYGLAALRSEVRHANPFDRDDIRQFFDDYALRSSLQGVLRVFQLKCGDDVVASRIGFALGTELYLYHSGNLPSWDRYSIMSTLLTEIFKWSIDNGFKLVNLSTGLDRSKARWRPREIMFVDATEIMPGKVNAALHRAYTRLRSKAAPTEEVSFHCSEGQLTLPKYDSVAESHDDN